MAELFRISSGGLSVCVSDDTALIEQAQKLRYAVFFDEKGGVASNPQVLAEKRDFDEYDAVCDHLLVLDDEAGGKVVGTYRLLRRGPMQKIGRFYTENEFQIDGIKALKGEIMELGRSCVAPEYRNRKAMQLLWRGIGEYVNQFDIKLLFGCASFTGVDPAAHQMTLSALHHYHRTDDALCPVSKTDDTFPLLPKDSVSTKQALSALPTMVKGYLRLNGTFGQGIFIDEECHCIDVAVVVQTDLLQDKHVKRYATKSG